MDVSKLYERGSQAFERGNWELAVMVWQQLLAIEPGHTDARKLLREAENRKWTQDGSGVVTKAMALIKGLPSIVAYGIHALTKSYDKAMMDCEKVLAIDPNCTSMLWALSRAAVKAGHPGVGVVTVEYIRDKNPKNKSALRQLARLYEEVEDIGRAIDTWQKLRQLAPADREAQTQLRDLAARKTMIDGKYETATDKGSDFTESLKDKDQAKRLEDSQRIIRTDDDLQGAIERVKKDIEGQPDNKRFVLQLGDLYRRAKNYEEARNCYARAREIDEMDVSILERLGETRIDEYSDQEKALQEQLKAAPDDAALQAKLAAVQKEKFDYSLEEFTRQVHARPTDSGLREKLGHLLFAAKKFDDAAVEYQKASADPRMRRRCLMRLGLCLYNTGKHQLAASQFEQAAEGGTANNAEIRDVLYYQAVTYEKLGDIPRAIKVLRDIFNVKMDYKDVKDRLERLMQASEPATSNDDGGPA